MQDEILSVYDVRYSYFLGLLYLYSGNLHEAKGYFSASLSLQQSASPEYRESDTWKLYLLEMKIFAEFAKVLDMPVANTQEFFQQMYSTYMPEPGSVKVNFDYDPYLIELVSQSLGRIHYIHDEMAQELAKLLQQKNFAEALAYLGRAYKATRSDAVVQQLGDVLSRHKPQGVSEQSRRYLAQANIYLEKRNYDQAVIAYLNVIEASPWAVDAFFNLAHIYATAGQHRNAIATMRQYLMLEPQGARSRQARDSIYRWEIEAGSTTR
jgi:tetratricopeptide (TPR) repeat protein